MVAKSGASQLKRRRTAGHGRLSKAGPAGLGIAVGGYARLVGVIHAVFACRRGHAIDSFRIVGRADQFHPRSLVPFWLHRRVRRGEGLRQAVTGRRLRRGRTIPMLGAQLAVNGSNGAQRQFLGAGWRRICNCGVREQSAFFCAVRRRCRCWQGRNRSRCRRSWLSLRLRFRRRSRPTGNRPCGSRQGLWRRRLMPQQLQPHAVIPHGGRRQRSGEQPEQRKVQQHDSDTECRLHLAYGCGHIPLGLKLLALNTGGRIAPAHGVEFVDWRVSRTGAQGRTTRYR